MAIMPSLCQVGSGIGGNFTLMQWNWWQLYPWGGMYEKLKLSYEEANLSYAILIYF